MQTLGQPQWVGQYRLTSRIATGGMAEVYVGRHISPEGHFGPMVAVKRLLPHLVKDPGIVRMFLNEARITAQIQHPNVVKIFELGQVANEPFIAMELLEGHTWAELRGRAADDGKRMPGPVALRILSDACRGLDAAHRAVDEEGQPLALVHRDFTPDNIHVGVNGAVKVIDFGIARTSVWAAGTEPGTLKGKFFYMSPEMITAQPVDHRADIFAAGVMLYEQLCGRRPFTGTSIDEVVMRIAREEPAKPSTYDPAIPKALEAICLSAIAKEPAQRPQSLAQFVDAIENLEGNLHLASPQDVATYVLTLFSEKDDARRDTLRRAREVDPSLPGHVPPSPITPAEGVDSAAPTRKPFFAIGLGLLCLLAAGAGAFFMLNRPVLNAAQQLAKAEQSKGEARVHEVLDLSAMPEVTEQQFNRGAALLVDANAWEPLLSFVDAWLLKSPKSVEARLYEAKAAVQTRKGKRAEAALRELATLAPNDARPDALMAELRELQADAFAALDSWTKAVAKAPDNAYYLSRQGYWLSQSGRLDDAENALTRASKKKPSPSVTAELGFVKFRKNQKDEALRLLRSVVKEKPDFLEGHYYLATVLFRKNDVPGARAEYLAADALSGSDSRPLTALCQMEQMQQTNELEAVKKKIRERFPKEADALLSKCAAADPDL